MYIELSRRPAAVKGPYANQQPLTSRLILGFMAAISRNYGIYY